jgi:hypothetical protein
MDRVDYTGSDLAGEVKVTSSATDCQTECLYRSLCDVWSWDKKNQLCYPKYKNATNSKRTQSRRISGPRKCSGSFLNIISKQIYLSL